ncbi:MAG: adenosine deaminase [Anaerolineales bacterium]|jgi:adenosine deaminase
MMIDPHLPLIDLHRHLDGNVRLETIIDLGRKHNLPVPSFDLEELRPYVQVVDPQPGVMAFIAKFEWMVKVLVDYNDCRRVAYENVIDAKAEGLDYLELRFSPWFMSEQNRLDPAGVVEAVVEGVQQGIEETGIGGNLIGIISRTYGVENGWVELNALLTQKDHIAALDLAGDEINFPAKMFVEHFKTGRDAGWQVTIHAGESSGPESIWQAIELLGATRIGHAVSMDKDARLKEFMLENRIGIESNLTSNFQTTTVSSLAEHPLKRWLEEGFLATINTDDPGISNIDLRYEFEVAAPAAGLTPQLTHQAQRNAVEIAFLSPDEKQALISSKA